MYEFWSPTFCSQIHSRHYLQALMAMTPILGCFCRHAHIVRVLTDNTFGISAPIGNHPMYGLPGSKCENRERILQFSLLPSASNK